MAATTFDDGTVQSRMLQADPAQLVLEYPRLMMGFLLFQPAPARIAMIGLGGGSLAKYCDYCRDRLAAGGVLVVNLYPDDAAYDGRVDRLRDSFAGNLVVIGADRGDNRAVFAGTDASFPPTFGEVVERLRTLEGSHPVGLDVTVRRILQSGEPRKANRRQRCRPSPLRTG